MRTLALAALIALLPPASSLQAQRGGTIFGVVRDSARAPVAGVDVIAVPGGGRARTDAEGRYSMGGVDNGAYTVMARRIGYAPEQWDVKLTSNGRVEINFTMTRRSDLDTVRVVATCDGLGVTGFECRKRAAKGGSLFFDYPDIDVFGERYSADVFRHIPGFLVFNRPDERGHVYPQWQLKSHPYKCLNVYVDGYGGGPSGAGIPRLTKDIVSIELYANTDSVPMTDPRYMYLQTASGERVRRCGVMFVWTIRAPINPPKASLAPKSPMMRGVR